MVGNPRSPDGATPSTPALVPWAVLVETARRYPSPHNSQPIKLEPVDERTARIHYDLDLGLPAESFGIPFGHVCAGVFLHALRVVARGSGYDTIEELDGGDLDFDAPASPSGGARLAFIGTVRLVEHEPSADDVADLDAFRARQTSRRAYDATLVDEHAIGSARAVAESYGQRFTTTSDRRLVDALIDVNQRTLFDDLQNDAVHGEILAWLRFSKRQAAERADGLSAETMLMPGGVLEFAMRHRALWRMPVIGPIFRGVYLNTMRGVRQLGWLEGPFAGPLDYIEAGRAFLALWLRFTRDGVFLHPFGTVITNPRSHARFVELAGITETVDREQGGSMAWMLFRFGRSKRPPEAHRRPAAAMLVNADGRPLQPAAEGEAD